MIPLKHKNLNSLDFEVVMNMRIWQKFAKSTLKSARFTKTYATTDVSASN